MKVVILAVKAMPLLALQAKGTGCRKCRAFGWSGQDVLTAHFAGILLPCFMYTHSRDHYQSLKSPMSWSTDTCLQSYFNLHGKFPVQ